MIERGPIPEDRAVLATAVWPTDAPRTRLDRVACTVFEAFPTRASARKAARRGELAVAGEVSEPARWVEPGTEVSWLEPAGARVPTLRIHVPVVFQDDVMAVMHKPGGIATSGALPRTLERTLPHNLTPSSAPDALQRPRPVHRLDAPTAGLVVVAKTRSAHADLGWQFQRREVTKRYRALVVGRLEGTGLVDTPIDDRPARTRYAALQVGPSVRGDHVTRVDAWPETGRTHQIRQHLASLGTPILGDARYGKDGLVLRGKGLFLFALELGLRHPQTRDPMSWTLPEPAKVGAFMAREARRWARIRSAAGPQAALDLPQRVEDPPDDVA